MPNSTGDNSASFLSLPSSTTKADPNRNSSSGCSLMVDDRPNKSAWCYSMDHNINAENNSSSALKAKIMAHPHDHRLLAAYRNCQKVGAPPEVTLKLEEACASAASVAPAAGTGCLGEDPALDQFMEAYCEMLIKYEQELEKPYKEAMLCLQNTECQFKDLIVSSDAGCEEGGRRGPSSEEADMRKQCIDPQAEDRELNGQLLRRYSGYLGSLKQELAKKLPKEVRQELLKWWSRHYKWPYPSVRNMINTHLAPYPAVTRFAIRC